MLATVEADVVAIAAEPRAHAQLATLALERGLHVLCEKPLALSHGDVEAVAAAHAARPGLAIASVHQYRYSPTWSRMSPWMRLASRHGACFDLTVDVERPSVDRHAATPWRADVSASGGMLADHGVHFLALAWTVSEDLEVVAAHQAWDASGAERSSATVLVGSGRLAIELSGGARARRTRVEADLLGTRLTWEDAAATLSVGARTAVRRRVEALSDREHVDGLYVPLYADVAANLGDPAWRRRATAETLSVARSTLSLLDLRETGHERLAPA
jgi:predicted dehydrogenase